jgi:hypothetical protein
VSKKQRGIFTDFDEVSIILTKWQHKEPLNPREQRAFYNFITSVCDDRWNRHFKNKHRDWPHTREAKLDLPLILMDYMKTPRSIRVKGPLGYYCDLDDIQYKTLGLVLFEFRIQFPRIVTLVTALDSGVALLGTERSNFYIAVLSWEYCLLHKYLVSIRKLAAERDLPLYAEHQYTMLDDVWNMEHKLPLLKDNRGKTIAPHNQHKRLEILYAAFGILSTKVSVSHEAFATEDYAYNHLST